MKVVFVGASLFESTVDLSGLEVRPPAVQGDVLQAVRDGAAAIGLIDGEFGQHASVQHKEVLFALDLGVAVFGASSMGALRAAECARFGMIPVGVIAQDYVVGVRDDDADVALLMAPAEMGSVALSEPLVDAEATLACLRALGHIDAVCHTALLARARGLHFSARTDETLLAESAPALLAQYRTNHVSQKRRDAELLVAALQGFDPRAARVGLDFTLAESPYWHAEFSRTRAARQGPKRAH